MEGSRKRRRSDCDEAACFRYATDFAGMDMVSFALRTWADLFTMIHVFASECNSVARRVLLANHRPRRVFHDVAQRNASDPEFRDLDLYAAVLRVSHGPLADSTWGCSIRALPYSTTRSPLLNRRALGGSYWRTLHSFALRGGVGCSPV